MTDILEQCKPLVLQTSRALARKFPALDVQDVEQEAWIWCTKNSRRLPELLEQPGLLCSYMAQSVRRELFKQGNTSTTHTYTTREVLAFLGAVLGPKRDEIVPKFRPVAKALEEAFWGLHEQDQEVLSLHAVEGADHAALAARLDLTRQAARRRLMRAVERLQLAFEATSVVEEDGAWSDRHVGTKVSMRNAHAQAVIANHYGGSDGKEPGLRTGGMRKIDE